jgi:hypothetical protein
VLAKRCSNRTFRHDVYTIEITNKSADRRRPQEAVASQSVGYRPKTWPIFVGAMRGTLTAIPVAGVGASDRGSQLAVRPLVFTSPAMGLATANRELRTAN